MNTPWHDIYETPDCTLYLGDCLDVLLHLEGAADMLFGPFGLVLEDMKPVPFIPVKGALGLFKWKENVEGVDHVRL
jgi:hypothetical protein